MGKDLHGYLTHDCERVLCPFPRGVGIVVFHAHYNALKEARRLNRRHRAKVVKVTVRQGHFVLRVTGEVTPRMLWP